MVNTIPSSNRNINTKILHVTNMEKSITINEAIDILGIRTRSRDRYTMTKRHLFWDYIRTKTEKNNIPIPYAKLGAYTGHDHATVIHGVKRVRDIGTGKYYKPYEIVVHRVCAQISNIELGIEKCCMKAEQDLQVFNDTFIIIKGKLKDKQGNVLMRFDEGLTADVEIFLNYLRNRKEVV